MIAAVGLASRAAASRDASWMRSSVPSQRLCHVAGATSAKWNSPAKLTDTQFAILSEASQRKDRCLIPPKTLKAAAAQKVATKLLKAGLVREIKAKTGMEAWPRRRNGPSVLVEID